MKNRDPYRFHLACVTTSIMMTGLLIQTGLPAFAPKHPEREPYFGET